MFETFGDTSYFKKIMGKPDVKDVEANREKYVNQMIDRAKYNIDSKPSPEKVEKWKSTINDVIDQYIQHGGELPEKSYEQMVREENIKLINSLLKVGSELDKMIKAAPRMFVEEAGMETILDYLHVEEKMMFQKPAGPSAIEPERIEGEDELDYILRKAKSTLTWEQVEKKLLHQFLRRLVANINQLDYFLKDEEEAKKFVRIYIEKFLYEYLIPMSKHKK